MKKYFSNLFKKKNKAKYGPYSNQNDFITKLNLIASENSRLFNEDTNLLKLTDSYFNETPRENIEKEPNFLKIIEKMNIKDNQDFLSKIITIIGDTLQNWEKCQTACTLFFCNEKKYPDKMICDQNKNQLSTKPISQAAKYCQTQITNSIGKKEVYANYEEENYLACSNIVKRIDLIIDLMYVYLINTELHDEHWDLIYKLFVEIPIIFKDDGISRNVKKINKKLNINPETNVAAAALEPEDDTKKYFICNCGKVPPFNCICENKNKKLEQQQPINSQNNPPNFPPPPVPTNILPYSQRTKNEETSGGRRKNKSRRNNKFKKSRKFKKSKKYRK